MKITKFQENYVIFLNFMVFVIPGCPEMHAPGGPCRGVFGDLPSEDSEILTEMFPLKGGGVPIPLPTSRLSPLSHTLLPLSTLCTL